jgi:hypothetical protein
MQRDNRETAIPRDGGEPAPGTGMDARFGSANDNASPSPDARLIEFVRALARAAAREDHRRHVEAIGRPSELPNGL